MCHRHHHPYLAGFVSGAGITRKKEMLFLSFVLWVQRDDLETFFFFFFAFQETGILAKKSCGLVFLSPRGFYTPTGFSTCCTTVGEGTIFILFQLRVPPLASHCICV